MYLTIRKFKLEEDVRISISIMSPFVILILQSLILYYFNIIGTRNGDLLQLTSKLLVGLVYLYSLPVVLKRSRITFLFAYGISTIIFLLNYILFKQNTPYLNDILIQFFFISIPSFIYSFSIRDKSAFKSVVKKSSYIIYAIGIIIGLLVFTNRMTIGVYNMSFGYYMLVPTIVYVFIFLERLSIKYAILSIISILIILAIGSRGPIISLIVFIIIYQIISIKKLTFKKLFYNVGMLMSLVLVVTYSKQIILLLISNLQKYGINSRSLILFLDHSMYLSGRDSIYEEIINQIYNNPIVGIGLTGDRLYLGTYSHNIILEILSSFGVVVGSLIILFLGFLILKSLFSKDLSRNNIMLIWFSIGVVPLLFSSSYITSFPFWIYLGLAVSQVTKKEKKILELNRLEKVIN